MDAILLVGQYFDADVVAAAQSKQRRDLGAVLQGAVGSGAALHAAKSYLFTVANLPSFTTLDSSATDPASAHPSLHLLIASRPRDLPDVQRSIFSPSRGCSLFPHVREREKGQEILLSFFGAPREEVLSASVPVNTAVCILQYVKSEVKALKSSRRLHTFSHQSVPSSLTCLYDLFASPPHRTVV